ncbi:MAG: hypothetical protein E6Q88_14355 [Lysobacteraceae bacterium]|nr:MAG: hypothetical protein E6Q88_14355 [Xanthomonadaceae bacterium]
MSISAYVEEQPVRAALDSRIRKSNASAIASPETNPGTYRTNDLETTVKIAFNNREYACGLPRKRMKPARSISKKREM